MQTIKPSPNQLFCKPEEGATKTVSGILLAGDGIEKPKIAQVVNVGSKVSEFSKGDRVIYKPYSTTDIKLEGTEYFLVAESDVLGKIVDE